MGAEKLCSYNDHIKALYVDVYGSIDKETESFIEDASFNELEELRQRTVSDYWKPQLLELLKESHRTGEWDEYIDFVLTKYEVFPLAFEANRFTKLPPNVQNKLATCAHTHNGDRYGCVQSALAWCNLNGFKNPDSLPQELRNVESITVYRAASEPLKEAARSSSWTIDLDVARWFAYEWNGKHASRIYEAKIKPCDVLLYTDERNEKEIIQKHSVFNVRILETVE